MSAMEGLGRVFNVVAAASGIHIPLKNCSGVTFVSFLDAGTQTVTLKQSVDGLSEVALTTVTKIYKAPGVGGTWTRVTQAAADNFNLTTDATNDSFCLYVSEDDLSDGYNCVEATAGSGILMAFLHDLKERRDPRNLPRNVV